MRVSSLNRKNTVIFTATVLLALTVVACSRQPSPQGSDGDVGQQLPFQLASDKNGISPTESLIPTAIPAGSPIIIRLQAPLSSASSRSGDSFAGVLDTPVMVEGQTLAPRGTIVMGKVVEARSSGPRPDPGYLRLTLTEISFKGQSLAMQTSSIFVKGGPHKKPISAMIGFPVATDAGDASRSSQDVGFAAGRRLTFLLTQTLPMHS